MASAILTANASAMLGGVTTVKRVYGVATKRRAQKGALDQGNPVVAKNANSAFVWTGAAGQCACIYLCKQHMRANE